LRLLKCTVNRLRNYLHRENQQQKKQLFQNLKFYVTKVNTNPTISDLGFRIWDLRK
jgi:hypothetical protein